MTTYIVCAVMSKALVSSSINPLDITARLRVCNVTQRQQEINVWIDDLRHPNLYICKPYTRAHTHTHTPIYMGGLVKSKHFNIVSVEIQFSADASFAVWFSLSLLRKNQMQP